MKACCFSGIEEKSIAKHDSLFTCNNSKMSFFTCIGSKYQWKDCWRRDIINWFVISLWSLSWNKNIMQLELVVFNCFETSFKPVFIIFYFYNLRTIFFKFSSIPILSPSVFILFLLFGSKFSQLMSSLFISIINLLNKLLENYFAHFADIISQYV